MKSADIKFYDRYSRTQVLYREDEYNRPFLPVTKRERGSGYYGHGNRTIGGYKCYSLPGQRNITPESVFEGRWVWEWIDPRKITYTMDEIFLQQARSAERRKQEQEVALRKQREIKAKFKKTGLSFQTVMEILGEPDRDSYQRRYLLRGERGVHFSLNADTLLKLIDAAQMAVPEVRHAREQAEVEAALALLGGM